MDVKIENNKIAIISSNDILISDIQSALDICATIQYQTQCSAIIINKENITSDFFNLSTCIAGDIL